MARIMLIRGICEGSVSAHHPGSFLCRRTTFRVDSRGRPVSKKPMDWVVIHTAQGPSEALVVRSLLESCGIEVKEVQETAGKLYALTMDGLGKIDIYVREDRADEARKLLEAKPAS
jgi:hypothetical protein